MLPPELRPGLLDLLQKHAIYNSVAVVQHLGGLFRTAAIRTVRIPTLQYVVDRDVDCLVCTLWLGIQQGKIMQRWTQIFDEQSRAIRDRSHKWKVHKPSLLVMDPSRVGPSPGNLLPLPVLPIKTWGHKWRIKLQFIRRWPNYLHLLRDCVQPHHPKYDTQLDYHRCCPHVPANPLLLCDHISDDPIPNLSSNILVLARIHH